MKMNVKTQDKRLTQSKKITVEDKALFSVFQPIYSFSNQACIGVEALVRGHSVKTGFQVPVMECLEIPSYQSPAEFNQNLNRMHLNNWQNIKLPNTWLFLNLDIQSVSSIQDLCIGSLIGELKVLGHEIVVEIVENEITDEDLFQKIIVMLRDFGCLIALDDFGAGHSNIDRIWKAQPDIVKLDRGVLLEATKSLRSESILRNLTRLIKQAGSVCLLEGIETQEQALLAMDMGVDLVQGFYFAKPRQLMDMVKQGETCIKDVTDRYPAYVAEQRVIKNIQKKGYQTLLEGLEVSSALNELETKMKQVAELSFVKRFYILDGEGYQVSDDYNRQGALDRLDVLRQGKGLCWRNRNYFVRAISQPDEVYVSEPYRSLIDMQLCLTISKVINVSGQAFVACFDVYYHDKSTDSVQISV